MKEVGTERYPSLLSERKAEESHAAATLSIHSSTSTGSFCFTLGGVHDWSVVSGAAASKVLGLEFHFDLGNVFAARRHDGCA